MKTKIILEVNIVSLVFKVNYNVQWTTNAMNTHYSVFIASTVDRECYGFKTLSKLINLLFFW